MALPIISWHHPFPIPFPPVLAFWFCHCISSVSVSPPCPFGGVSEDCDCLLFRLGTSQDSCFSSEEGFQFGERTHETGQIEDLSAVAASASELSVQSATLAAILKATKEQNTAARVDELAAVVSKQNAELWQKFLKQNAEIRQDVLKQNADNAVLVLKQTAALIVAVQEQTKASLKAIEKQNAAILAAMQEQTRAIEKLSSPLRESGKRKRVEGTSAAAGNKRATSATNSQTSAAEKLVSSSRKDKGTEDWDFEPGEEPQSWTSEMKALHQEMRDKGSLPRTREEMMQWAPAKIMALCNIARGLGRQEERRNAERTHFPHHAGQREAGRQQPGTPRDLKELRDHYQRDQFDQQRQCSPPRRETAKTTHLEELERLKKEYELRSEIQAKIMRAELEAKEMILEKRIDASTILQQQQQQQAAQIQNQMRLAESHVQAEMHKRLQAEKQREQELQRNVALSRRLAETEARVEMERKLNIAKAHAESVQRVEMNRRIHEQKQAMDLEKRLMEEQHTQRELVRKMKQAEANAQMLTMQRENMQRLHQQEIKQHQAPGPNSYVPQHQQRPLLQLQAPPVAASGRMDPPKHSNLQVAYNAAQATLASRSMGQTSDLLLPAGLQGVTRAESPGPRIAAAAAQDTLLAYGSAANPGSRLQQVVQHGGSLSGGASGVLQQPETIVTHPGSAIVTHPGASVGLQPSAAGHPAGLSQPDYLQQQEKRQWY